MQRRFARTLLSVFIAPLFVAIALAVGTALAQEGDDKSGFVRFLENLLSAPDRQVSLTGVEDAFSWHPKVERITVSDSEGVWLQLDGVEIVWTRAALFRRMLDIDVLRAARVTMLRMPVVAETSEASGGVSGPPLEITIDTLALPQIALAAPVIGAEAELSASGSAKLTAEALALQLSIDRQDRAGSLAADLRFEPANNVLTADLRLEEPGEGLLVELLGLRSRPAIAVTLSGGGPLDQWQANLEMHADGVRVVSGAMSISRVENGYRVFARLAAALDTLVPEDYAALVAGESGVDFELSRFDDGSISIATATLHSEGVDLAASGVVGADMVPRQAKLSLNLGQAGRAELPFLPSGVSLAGLRATAELDPGEAAPWRVEIAAEGAEGAFGRIAGLAINAIGQAQNLANPKARATSFKVEGSAEGVALADPALRDAVGSSVRVSGTGSWSAGLPVTIEALSVALANSTASFAGTATREALDGSFAASIGDLSRFAALAGRGLAGSAELKATGTATTAGAFDLKLDGATTDLALGIATLDPLFQGATRIEGGIAWRDGGFVFETLKLSNDRATTELSGSFGDPALDLTVSASIADLALVTPRTAGAARINARLSGSRAAPEIEAEAAGENVVLMGRPLADATARFSGIVAGPQTAGETELAGTLGDAAVHGAARLSAGADGARVLDGLVFSVGESKISGDLSIGAGGLLSGDVKVVSPDLSKVAPLFLVEASGMLRGEVALAAEGGVQSATFSGTATDIVYESVTLESADIKGAARDLFRAPQIEGDFSIRNMNAGGFSIVSATGTARRQGESTALVVDAQLADGRAKLEGSLAPRGSGLAIGLQSFAYSRPGIDLALAAPTTIAVEAGTVRFDRTTFNAGGGSVALSGEAGANLDIAATLNSVPAALANSFIPNLGAEGTVSGTVNAQGTPAAPNATFNITLANASVAASRNAGLGPLGVSTEGTLADKILNLKSRISGAGGLAVDVAGTVGTAQGAPLNLRVTGGVPLALGNTQLASRGAALEGALNLDVAVAGTASAPKFSGRVTSEGGGFVDPETGIVLRNLALVATVSGDRIVVEKLGAVSGEGNVSAMGSIGLDPNSGFPVELAVQVRQARYVDGTLVAARFDADLKLTGNFSDGPLLEGAVILDRTEVAVPERLPRDSVAVDVEHVAPPAPVEETLAAVRQRDEPAGGPGGRRAGIRLDVTVNAPRRIFVRGRGLDTEFGGDLRLTGPTSSLTAAGAFQMVRGRLDILTQRIVFDRGTITFAGDLDPILEFSGSTRSGDVTITVTVAGRASDPEVIFSSVPELPQDEILAQLIFSKGIGELSPLQVARLAAAASELSGGSGGILSRLRASTGLDDLDIVTDEKGETSVAAGRYVSENVYIGVQQGTTAQSGRVTIDLDVTKDVKARAGMSAEGESSLGIFFEREY